MEGGGVIRVSIQRLKGDKGLKRVMMLPKHLGLLLGGL